MQQGPVTVIGTSLGGLVAVRFAELFPDLVDRLVLIAPVGLPVKSPFVTNFVHIPVRWCRQETHAL